MFIGYNKRIELKTCMSEWSKDARPQKDVLWVLEPVYREVYDYCKLNRTTAGVRIDYDTLSRWTGISREGIAQLAESIDKAYVYRDRVPGGYFYRVSHFGLPKMVEVACQSEMASVGKKLDVIRCMVDRALK
jgi:hypothetical protein